MVAEQKKTTRDSLPNNKIDLDADTIENHRRRKDAPISKLTPRSGLVKKKKKGCNFIPLFRRPLSKAREGCDPHGCLAKTSKQQAVVSGGASAGGQT